MKPQIIQAWAGDSISIKCRIFDETGEAFDPTAFEIDAVELCVLGLPVIEGTMSGNVAQVFVPAGTLTVAGKYGFYLQVKGSGVDACFTVLTGVIQVSGLPI